MSTLHILLLAALVAFAFSQEASWRTKCDTSFPNAASAETTSVGKKLQNVICEKGYRLFPRQKASEPWGFTCNNGEWEWDWGWENDMGDIKKPCCEPVAGSHSCSVAALRDLNNYRRQSGSQLPSGYVRAAMEVVSPKNVDECGSHYAILFSYSCPVDMTFYKSGSNTGHFYCFKGHFSLYGHELVTEKDFACRP
eukprot:m.83541 g.83541  ORF g.83541 m.83541 type:complete len:195 (+) comp36354_c0_seq1:156-740(+)